MRWPLTLVVLALVSAASAGEPEYSFTDCPDKEDSFSSEKDGSLIRIKSSRRIGHVSITPKKGDWPEQITVFLEGLNELEHFEVCTGRMLISGSAKQSGKFELVLLGKDRDVSKSSPAGTLNLQVKKQKDGVAIVFPAKLLIEKDSVQIGWIDWLRR